MPTAHIYKQALSSAVGNTHCRLALMQVSLALRALTMEQRSQLSGAAMEHSRKKLDSWFGQFLTAEVKNLIASASAVNDWEALEELAANASDTENETVITLAKPPSSEFESMAREKIAHAGGSAVRFVVDRELIGGVKIRIGGREADFSVRGKLAKLI